MQTPSIQLKEWFITGIYIHNLFEQAELRANTKRVTKETSLNKNVLIPVYNDKPASLSS